MASITINVKSVSKGLSNMQKNFLNMSRFYKNLADLELSQTMLRFRTEKDPDGKNWPDSNTIRRDSGGSQYSREEAWDYVLSSNFHAVPKGWHWFNRSRGDKVLTDTGTLRRSLGIAYGPDYAIVGTNLSYAKKHQDGDGVQQRRFLGVNKQTEENVNIAMTAFLKGLLR